MTVENVLKIYEVGGEKQEGPQAPKLKILSHWNDDNMVVIETSDCKRITVFGPDLERAIKNARNFR